MTDFAYQVSLEGWSDTQPNHQLLGINTQTLKEARIVAIGLRLMVESDNERFDRLLGINEPGLHLTHISVLFRDFDRAAVDGLAGEQFEPVTGNPGLYRHIIYPYAL